MTEVFSPLNDEVYSKVCTAEYIEAKDADVFQLQFPDVSYDGDLTIPSTLKIFNLNVPNGVIIQPILTTGNIFPNDSSFTSLQCEDFTTEILQLLGSVQVSDSLEVYGDFKGKNATLLNTIISQLTCTNQTNNDSITVTGNLNLNGSIQFTNAVATANLQDSSFFGLKSSGTSLFESTSIFETLAIRDLWSMNSLSYLFQNFDPIFRGINTFGNSKISEYSVLGLLRSNNLTSTTTAVLNGTTSTKTMSTSSLTALERIQVQNFTNTKNLVIDGVVGYPLKVDKNWQGGGVYSICRSNVYTGSIYIPSSTAPPQNIFNSILMSTNSNIRQYGISTSKNRLRSSSASSVSTNSTTSVKEIHFADGSIQATAKQPGASLSSVVVYTLLASKQIAYLPYSPFPWYTIFTSNYILFPGKVYEIRIQLLYFSDGGGNQTVQMRLGGDLDNTPISTTDVNNNQRDVCYRSFYYTNTSTLTKYFTVEARLTTLSAAGIITVVHTASASQVSVREVGPVTETTFS